MRKKYLFLFSILLVSGSTILPLAKAQETNFDLKIEELKAIESIDNQGKVFLDIQGIIVNTLDKAAENCSITLTINEDKHVNSVNYLKIEKGSSYLFSDYVEAPVAKGKNVIKLSACEQAQSEKNPDNNSKTISITTSGEKAISIGLDVDLNLKNYRAMLVKNKDNQSKYWFALEYENKGKNFADTFSTSITYNGKDTENYSMQSLPGKSNVSYPGFNFPERNPYLEGKNLVKIKLDANQVVEETNEKNTFYYIVTVSDGEIISLKKETKEIKFLVQGLIVTDQNAINQPNLPQSPNDLILNIPVLNAYTTLQETPDNPIKIRIDLKSNNLTFSQNFELATFEAGKIENFYFTTHFFKKNEMKKQLNLTVYVNGEKIYNKSLKPHCFY